MVWYRTTPDHCSGKVPPSPKPAESSQPSFVPSQSPTEFPFIFEGIEDAISIYRGTIDLTWDFPTYNDGEIVDLETVRYHVFASVGSYDFANITVEELITEFESDSLTFLTFH